ncbi:MAG TPA: 3-dehydroquinate synthase [Crocinitomicaceae bacterium]|nr:3-dehydroquinate synthase [Crocinitomicaceae bacterium]
MEQNKHQIQCGNYTVHVSSALLGDFEMVLSENYTNAQKIIFVDENTHEYCLEYLLTNFDDLHDAEVIVLPSGEENKTIHTCIHVWEALAEYQISRHAVAICLGGGVVTDMGGLISSLYKRGIDFIHVPTSLLAMVDASIGGKTAVDLAHFKNMIGVFSNPKAVFIDTVFLQTLPIEDKIGGWFEMLKHGLIADKAHWEELKTIDFNAFYIKEEWICHSLEIKNTIVTADFNEKNIRKNLNFGHTFGHAVESLFLANNETLNHGIAVGMGILVESFWSWKLGLLDETTLAEICETITEKISLPSLENVQAQQLWNFMLNDKKNNDNKVLSVLLTAIGKAIYDQEITFELVEEGLGFYKKF